MTPASLLVELARAKVGQAYVLGCRVPYGDRSWAGPWDCAELATWAAFQACGKLVGVTSGGEAYSGAWVTCAAQDWRSGAQPQGVVLTPSVAVAVSPETAAATVGAILVRAPGAPGRSGHVAISAGAGATVEAYSSTRGVIASTSAGRRWDVGILVPGLAYTMRAGAPLSPPAVLRVGSVGEAVSQVQSALGAAGYPCGLVDGRFGPRTLASVVAFQAARGLVADGEVGPLTAAALGVGL